MAAAKPELSHIAPYTVGLTAELVPASINTFYVRQPYVIFNIVPALVITSNLVLHTAQYY